MKKTNRISPSLTTRAQADWLRNYSNTKEVEGVSVGQIIRKALEQLRVKLSENGGIVPYIPTEPMVDRIPMVLLDDEQFQFIDELSRDKAWGSRAAVIRTAVQTMKGNE